MTLTGRIPIIALLTTCLLQGFTAKGQGGCTNLTEYPLGVTITPDALGAVTSIATCQFEAEYSHIGSIIAGAAYQFTLSTGNYITVHQGTFDGPVIAEGYSPVNAVAVDAGDLYPHWNVDETCAQATGTCIVTTVQLFLNCVPPTVNAVFHEECDLQEFTIDINITDTGDSSIVNIVYDQGGGPVVIPGVGVGTTTLGPYFFGEFIDIIVEHETDPMCNVNLGHFEATGDCPVTLTCGGPAQPVTYCYGNNVDEIWNYNSTMTGSLVLTFFSGTIENSNLDQLTIYDGPDNTGPILFQHTAFTTFDLAGLVLASTTGAIHMELHSDDAGSCGDATQSEWNWQVACLDCYLPQATVSSVDDCPNNQFNLPIDITSVGDGGTVEILYTVNGGAVQTVSGVGVGITNLGPFTVNDIIAIQVNHATNPACNIDLGTHTDQGTCPNLITCGAPPIIETYCYQPSDFQDWSYTSVGSGTLRLQFHQGTIETNVYDNLRIYEGVDNTGTLVFAHGDLTTNLGPVGSAIDGIDWPYETISIYSLTGSLYMEMTSDGSVQCGGEFPTESFDSWEWDVVCLDCNIPFADITVVDSCALSTFTLDVDVTGTGNGTTAGLDYTVNGGTVQNLSGLPLGVTTLGPFAFGDIVNVTLLHESNSLCNIPMGDWTNTGTCPLLIACDGTFVNDSACYDNGDDLRWYYQGTGTYPLGIYFFSGDYAFADSLIIYDGGDITAPVLFAGGDDGLDMTGEFFYTTNPEHRLCLRIFSNDFTSCAEGFVGAQTEWQIGCLDCVPPTAEFNIVQDCENFQYFIDVIVSSLGSDAEMEILNTGGQPATSITAAGTYQVGPFVSGTPVEITVQNDANSLCNVYSEVMVNPLCPTMLCGGTPLIETYCYIDLDNMAWAYEAPTPGATIQLIFNRGTIESNSFDHLNIYDGPDATGPVLFTHPNFEQHNLGPTGSAIDSPDAPYYAVSVTTLTGNLYMTLTTDGSVSCTGTPDIYDEWEWSVQCVGCAAPGVSYNTVADCRHRLYKTEVIVTETPDSLGLEVVEMITGDTILVTATGVYEFGPFAVDGPSLFGVTDLVSPNCTYFSDTLTYSSDSCVIRSCGFDYYTYCYENDEDRWYTYQSLENVPTTISFTQGQLLSNDRIVIYNGFDESAMIIYQGSNGGNLTGFQVNSQNPDNTITLHIESNDAGSCETGEATVEMNWIVGCGAVGMDEVAADGFSVFPNPTQGSLFVELGSKVYGNVRLRVMDMSGRTVLDDPFMVQSGGRRTVDLRGLQSGQYMVQLTTDNWVKTQRVQLAR